MSGIAEALPWITAAGTVATLVTAGVGAFVSIRKLNELQRQQTWKSRQSTSEVALRTLIKAGTALTTACHVAEGMVEAYAVSRPTRPEDLGLAHRQRVAGELLSLRDRTRTQLGKLGEGLGPLDTELAEAETTAAIHLPQQATVVSSMRQVLRLIWDDIHQLESQLGEDGLSPQGRELRDRLGSSRIAEVADVEIRAHKALGPIARGET